MQDYRVLVLFVFVVVVCLFVCCCCLGFLGCWFLFVCCVCFIHKKLGELRLFFVGVFFFGGGVCFCFVVRFVGWLFLF